MSIDPNEHRFLAMIRIYKIFLLAEVMAFGNSHSSYDGIYWDGGRPLRELKASFFSWENKVLLFTCDQQPSKPVNFTF